MLSSVLYLLVQGCNLSYVKQHTHSVSRLVRQAIISIISSFPAFVPPSPCRMQMVGLRRDLCHGAERKLQLHRAVSQPLHHP